MAETTYLSDWINNEMVRGRYIFTKSDVLALHIPISNQSLQNSLSRLTERGVIVSPWHNFYITIPTEYKLKGIIPPSFYIDRLMKFLERDYYVSLLSAAELNGATHQKPMLFQVIANGKSIRSCIKNSTHLEFTLRKNLPLAFTKQVKTQTGYMNVSGAELTALDMVAEEKKVGGLSRTAEVLMELSESMLWDKTKLPLIEYFSSATIQRLGYLLSQIGAHNHADDLFVLLKQSGKTFRKIPLKQSTPITLGMPVDMHWKVINNYNIEIDEI